MNFVTVALFHTIVQIIHENSTFVNQYQHPKKSVFSLLYITLLLTKSFNSPKLEIS